MRKTVDKSALKPEKAYGTVTVTVPHEVVTPHHSFADIELDSTHVHSPHALPAVPALRNVGQAAQVPT